MSQGLIETICESKKCRNLTNLNGLSWLSRWVLTVSALSSGFTSWLLRRQHSSVFVLSSFCKRLTWSTDSSTASDISIVGSSIVVKFFQLLSLAFFTACWVFHASSLFILLCEEMLVGIIDWWGGRFPACCLSYRWWSCESLSCGWSFHWESGRSLVFGWVGCFGCWQERVKTKLWLTFL